MGDPNSCKGGRGRSMSTVPQNAFFVIIRVCVSVGMVGVFSVLLLLPLFMYAPTHMHTTTGGGGQGVAEEGAEEGPLRLGALHEQTGNTFICVAESTTQKFRK